MIFQTHPILITVSHQIIMSVASVWQKSYRVPPPPHQVPARMQPDDGSRTPLEVRKHSKSGLELLLCRLPRIHTSGSDSGEKCWSCGLRLLLCYNYNLLMVSSAPFEEILLQNLKTNRKYLTLVTDGSKSPLMLLFLHFLEVS